MDFAHLPNLSLSVFYSFSLESLYSSPLLHLSMMQTVTLRFQKSEWTELFDHDRSLRVQSSMISTITAEKRLVVSYRCPATPSRDLNEHGNVGERDCGVWAFDYVILLDHVSFISNWWNLQTIYSLSIMDIALCEIST